MLAAELQIGRYFIPYHLTTPDYEQHHPARISSLIPKSMTTVSTGSRIFAKWLHAHAELSQGGECLGNWQGTIHDILQEMECQCLPFCRTASEEYNLALNSQSRTLHPRRLLLQQGAEGSAMFFTKAQQLRQKLAIYVRGFGFNF
jgi:hypothetical protein